MENREGNPETNDDGLSFDSPFCIARSFVPNILDDMIMVKLKSASSVSSAPKLLKNTYNAFSMGSINGKGNLYTVQKESDIKIKEFEPKSISFKGVCLIADISGFTKLSARLCSLGKDGVDELQKATNGYMSKLVDSIYEYGGDIIKFAGDAIICTFKPHSSTDEIKPISETECIREACVRALECTWKLKDHKTQDMTMHIAIGYGITHLALLGGYKDNWEILVSGQYLSNLGTCLDEAGVGEIVTSMDFFEALNGSSTEKVDFSTNSKVNNNFCEVSGELTSARNVKITAVANLKNVQLNKPPDRLIIKSYETYYSAMQRVVPLPIIHSLSNSTFDTLAQLREVTTMFMKFDGYNYNDHGDILKLQRHFFEAQKILSASGGFLRQFLVDDKGCVLIGIWGIPEYAHVDNGKRALLAAIDIRERLLDMKMNASFGITTGSVYCGLVGSNIRREYCVIGSVVNLAARLMGKSKGSVLIDQATYDKLELNAKNLLILQEPILVKGIATPVTTFLYDVGKSSDEAHQVVDIPLRSICKEALNPHVLELVKGKSTFNTIASATRRMSLTSNKSRYIHDNKVHVNIHIVEGHAGMGSEEIRPWLQKRAEMLNIDMISVEVNGSQNYSAVKNIFISLISHDVYYNRAKQSFVVHSILKELYDNNQKFMEKVGYHVMRIAFGINVPFKKKNKASMNSSRSERIVPVAKETASDELLQPIEFVNPIVCKKVAYEILTHLLSNRSRIILIEKAHGMDEESWRILSMFVEGTMRLMFVYTQEPISHFILSDGGDDDLSSFRNMKTSHLPTAMYEKDLLKHDNVHFLKLPKYSFQETRAHFLYRMNYNFNLPAKLDLYVYKLSGGNPFWISHIISFIDEQGVDEFMNIMNNAESKTKKEKSKERKSSLFSTFTTGSKHDTLRTSFSDIISTRSSFSELNSSADVVQDNFDSIGKLQHFILCRLEKLSLDGQEVLREASIIGNCFTEVLLCSCVTEVLHTKLKPILASLIGSGWIYKEISSSKNTSYSFCHEVVRDTLYELSPKSLKETLHAKIADFMVESKMNDNELIAYHYLRSGPDIMNKSFNYSYNAAENFLQDDLYDEFFRNIDNALAAMNSSDRIIALHKLINIATNKMRSALLANVVKISSNNGYNDTFYGRFTKYFSCRRNNDVLIDNTIRKHQYIMDRLQVYKTQISSKVLNSPLRNNLSSKTASKSFFQSFKSPSKSQKLGLEMSKIFTDDDDEFVT